MNLLSARWHRACTLIVGAFFLSPPLNAQELFNPTGPLTLGMAIEAALRNNADLVASSYELTAAQARTIQANLRRNPQLSVDVENFAGTGGVSGVKALESTLSLSQVVELGDKRARRRETAEADFDLIAVEQQARELDVLTEVTRRFIAVVAAEERVSLAGEIVALSNQTFNAIDTRVSAGRSPEAERTRARIASTRARIEHEQAQSALRSSRSDLAVLWGSNEASFTSARAELFALRPVESFEELARRLEESPDLARFASERRLREAELRLAQVQARPNLAFSAGLRRLQSGNETALVAGFSVPLMVYDRNQGTIREAQARLTQSGALREAAQNRIRASLFSLHQELLATRNRFTILSEQAIPEARLALEQTRIGYARGRFSFLELATAQEELFVIRAAALEAAADFHRVLAEIERLTNRALVRPAP